jgi:O-Antigen ligase
LTRSEGFLVHMLLLWVIVLSMFTERIFILLPTGGRGALQLFVILTPAIAFILLLVTNGKVISFLKKKKFIIFFLPYILLTFILPFLGVLFYGYPIRVLFGIMLSINAISMVVIGYWIANKFNKNPRIEYLIPRYIIISVTLQLVYSVGQYLFRSGYISGVWLPFFDWDFNTTISAGVDMVYSRSTGLFLNANILGFWAALSYWASTLLIRTKLSKFYCQISSLVVLMLSQSRGAIIALVVTVSFTIIFNFAKRKKVTNPLILIPKICFACVLFIILIYTGVLEKTFIERISDASGILTTGVSSDTNFSTRVNVWTEALSWFHNYPFGTFGSPELLFDGFIDNDWMRLFLQGSIFYLLSFVGLIVGSLSLMKHSKYGYFVGVTSLLIGICAITQTPLAYAPMATFWFFIGFVSFNKIKT